MARRKRKVRSPAEWENLPDSELLQIPVRELSLQIEGSPLEACVSRLYEELSGRGLCFRPPCYLADEWLCPDKVPVIGIPFFLAHPRLKSLERKMMLDVEGGTESSCMKLLRHEAGHALNYAYELFKRTRWREHFGPFSARYSDYYDARPYSKRYVVHLSGNYAQAHPDEDFAETFAVWLNPRNRWRERYRGWPALRKLKYVDRVVRKLADQPPKVSSRETPWSAARMRSTLDTYYERKRRHKGDDFPGYYDPALQRLFGHSQSPNSSEGAAVFLKRWRRHIVNSVATWTGERKFDTDTLIKKLIRRCRELGLYLHRSQAETLSEVTVFVTAVMKNVHRFTEDYRGK
jgi:hypothetical protein